MFATRTIVVALARGDPRDAARRCGLRSAPHACRRSPPCAKAQCYRPSRFARFSVTAALLDDRRRGRAHARRAASSTGSRRRSDCSPSASARRPCSWASRCSRRRSFHRSRACSAGRRRRSADLPVSSPRGNAMRNPQRTASTASALMIGLALVTLVSRARVGAEDDVQQRRRLGLQGRLRADRDRQLLPDLDRVGASPARRCRASTVVSGVRAGDGKAFGSRINVTGVPPDISEGHRRQLGATARRRLPAQLGEERCVRRQGVREGPAPVDRLAHRGRGAVRQDAAPHAEGHLRTRRRAARRTATSRSRSSASTRSTRTRRTSSPSSTWPAASPPRTRRR